MRCSLGARTALQSRDSPPAAGPPAVRGPAEAAKQRFMGDLVPRKRHNSKGLHENPFRNLAGHQEGAKVTALPKPQHDK